MTTTCRAPVSKALRSAICPAGPAPPDRHRIGWGNVALSDGLPFRRHNVAEKPHLLICLSLRHLHVRFVGERHVLGVAA